MKHVNKILAGLITCCVILLLSGCSPRQGEKHDFSIGKGTFLLDGKPFVIKAAEIHYTRIPAEYWQHRIQMCKALGMNTICIYAFWNIHEQKPGEFDFKGQNDIAAFCRLAQKEGMYIMLRPGPYVCSEWEMGGLPWWLLKKEDIKLRTNDPYFLERTKLFMNEIGKQLADLQVTRGGNIIMVQVENEYGAYATDKAYIANIRDAVKAAGFTDVPLFQCDWSSTFQLNGLDDLVWTINFGTGANIDAQFKKLKEARPDAPLMCSEFWSGWFDHWGRKHETRDAGVMVSGIKDMLDRHISFSLYMAHGGTTFGHWGGANSPAYSAMCSSYDYDAPISEAGWATPKYYKLRELLTQYADSGQVIPDVPAAYPLIEIPAFTEGYEGFSHLCEMHGEVELTTLEYIIRDHDAAGFDARLALLRRIADDINVSLGDGTVTLTIREQYRNMAEKIQPHMHLIRNAERAARAVGAEPAVHPIRGGTDGARLSFMGLPCPNLGTGGYAFHGPYEHITVEGMDTETAILLELVRLYADRAGDAD